MLHTPRWTLLLVMTALAFAGIAAATPGAAAGPVNARGSVEQAYATGVTPGTEVSLVDAGGDTVATAEANELGGVLFREVAPGTGYTMTGDGETSEPFEVWGDDPTPADTAYLDQTITHDGGYQYITMRDGTQLALTVHQPTRPAGLLPLPQLPLPNIPLNLPLVPPYPTLIEYSGYGTADPDGPVSGIAALANLAGFAVVDVSMRGTGCSGGAFDFFEPLQSLDGYDVIEIISRQDWVRGNKVGMIGISYGGISQLFTAQTQPPSLAAIAPLSVIDSVPTTLYPGGIRNDGFAVEWAEERQREAQAAGQGLEGTQAYAEKRYTEGDQTCIDNQALHPDAADLMTKIEANDVYRPEIADPLDPVTFVDKINVPVFMACQWQDEQTGGHCPTLAGKMTGTDKKWFTFTNGTHTDSLDPETFNRWYDFLHIYVAEQQPALHAAVINVAAPLIYQTAFGLPQSEIMTLPPDPIQLQPTLAGARQAFEAQPSVRVLFNNGAGSPSLPILPIDLPLPTASKGAAYPGFEHSFDSWPIPGTTARSWYFGPGESLTDEPASASETHRFTADPRAVDRTSFDGPTRGGGLWGNQPQWSWDWQDHPEQTSLSYVTEPLADDTVAVGAGRVEFWARSSTPDVDFQVTVSEIDSDGNETFVQNGWVRGSKRALSTSTNNVFKSESTLLNPILSLAESDLAAMPSEQFAQVVVPLYFSGHPYRAGSRIRVVISAPNGSQPIWAFDHPEPATGTSTVDVMFSADRASRLVLPIVDADVPTAQPECGVLRNQPCRAFAASANLVIDSDVDTGTNPGTGTGTGPGTDVPTGTGPLPLVPTRIEGGR